MRRFELRGDASGLRNGPLLGAVGLAVVRPGRQHGSSGLVCDLIAGPSLLLAAQLDLGDAFVFSLTCKKKTLKNVITSFSECSCGNLSLTAAAVHLYAHACTFTEVEQLSLYLCQKWLL